MPATTRAQRMTQLLQAAFAPQELRIVDDSAQHAGHAGAQGLAGETHYTVQMVAQVFAGQSRVRRAREVHAVLAPELASGLHALALVLRSPQEAGNHEHDD